MLMRAAKCYPSYHDTGNESSKSSMLRPYLVMLFGFLMLFSFSARAQQDTLTVGNKREIDQVVVSAQRTPVVYSRLSRIVSVTDKEMINQMPQSSIHGVLDQISGVDVRQRGPMGMQADVSIRGSSFDQNMILLNGIDITDPQTGHFAMNLPVNLSDVKEIEVLKGPGSRVFGPNAFGGAINIITAPADSNHLSIELTGGSHGLYQATALTSFQTGSLKNRFSFSKSASRGYRTNTDFDTYSLYYQGMLRMGDDRLQMQVGHKSKGYGAQGFYTPEYPHQYEHAEVSLVSLGMDIEGTLEMHPSIYWRRHQNRFELFREGENWYQPQDGYWVKDRRDTAKYVEGVYQPGNYYSGHNYHLTDVVGVKTTSSYTSSLGKTSLGFDMRSEQIWSNVLGRPMNDTLSAKGGGRGYYDKKYHRSLINFYLEHNIYLKRFSLSAGLLVSRSNEHDPGWRYYPGIDLSYQMTSGLTSYASFNRSLRMPTFTDLFYQGPSNVGNPDLKPEKVLAWEGGLKFNAPFLRGHLSFFHHDGRQLIAWSRRDDQGGQVRWKARNITRLINQGLEVSLNARINGIWEEASFIRRFSLHYTTMNQRKLSSDGRSKYSLNYPDARFKARLTAGFQGFRFSISADYLDRAGKYLNYNFRQETYTGQQPFKPYWLFDARVGYQWGNWKLYGEVTNLFDSQYSDIGNIRLPGRWIKVGLERTIALSGKD